MKEYMVTARMGVRIQGGVVRLSNDQARRRRHLTEPVKDGEGKEIQGLFNLVSPCMFKMGEKFFYDGEVSKLTLREMEDVEEAKKRKAKKEAARKADAKEKAADKEEEAKAKKKEEEEKKAK